jgi:hypothetical protein
MGKTSRCIEVELLDLFRSCNRKMNRSDCVVEEPSCTAEEILWHIESDSLHCTLLFTFAFSLYLASSHMLTFYFLFKFDTVPTQVLVPHGVLKSELQDSPI